MNKLMMMAGRKLLVKSALHIQTDVHLEPVTQTNMKWTFHRSETLFCIYCTPVQSVRILFSSLGEHRSSVMMLQTSSASGKRPDAKNEAPLDASNAFGCTCVLPGLCGASCIQNSPVPAYPFRLGTITGAGQGQIYSSVTHIEKVGLNIQTCSISWLAMFLD